MLDAILFSLFAATFALALFLYVTRPAVFDDPDIPAEDVLVQDYDGVWFKCTKEQADRFPKDPPRAKLLPGR